jgi:ABC-type phosphate/phosphonate transport system ATPase subunit
MPLPGGPTDKFGNRYEGRWTVFCMIEVMREHADSIRLEPPGAEGEGVEFWVRRGNEHIYHQVKRQQSGVGRWTLGELQEKRVLSNFWQKLAEKTAQCMFVSTHAPYQLENLIYQAKSAASFQEFESVFFNTKDHREAFQALVGYWKVSQPEDAYEALKRVNLWTESEETLLINVESHLEYLVDGHPATIRSELADFALDNIHAEITAHNIWSYLETLGHHRRRWDNDPHILVAVQEATERYLGSFRNTLINGQVIFRDAAQTILDVFIQQNSQHCVLLSGEAGAGKSGTLLQVIQGCREQNWPLLAFRADRLHSTQLPKYIGQQIGLPGSPANVLAAIAHEQDCLLVIDQIDAVSVTSGRHPEMFDCLFEIIKQAMAHPNMRILLACRKFDLDYDRQLRVLTDQGRIAQRVEVGRLTHIQVRQIVTALGLDAQKLTIKQLDLLSIPLHLRLLDEISSNASGRTLSFETAKDLFDLYWRDVVDPV